jgi:hypothetical protein
MEELRQSYYHSRVRTIPTITVWVGHVTLSRTLMSQRGDATTPGGWALAPPVMKHLVMYTLHQARFNSACRLGS